MKFDCRGIKNIFILRISLLDSYIFKQLSLFFLFSVGLFTSLGVTVGTVADLAYKITEYSLPISVSVLVFFNKIPEYIAYALPISILLTCLVIYGRLNSDRELTAILSFGINFYRLALPALLLSLLVIGITFLLNELIVPATNYQANLLQTAFIAKNELNLQRKDIFYPEYELSRQNSAAKKLRNMYFAEQYHNQTLQKLIIISFEQSKIKKIITAKSAQWNQRQQVWNLIDGEINTVVDGVIGIKTNQFNRIQLPLAATVFNIAEKKRSLEDMNIRQTKEYLSLIKDSGKATDIARLQVRIQQKYAFPFICLVFALIGSSLGTKYDYLNRSTSFGLCVAIVFAYYCLGFTIGSLGISGLISPFWAAWIPNLLGLSTGFWLLKTANI
jgi:lipopolysaccharide export system permease protein